MPSKLASLAHFTVYAISYGAHNNRSFVTSILPGKHI